MKIGTQEDSITLRPENHEEEAALSLLPREFDVEVREPHADFPGSITVRVLTRQDEEKAD